MTSSQLKVTFLGLGSMGSGIAKNILKKGFQLVVWSRTASKADVCK
jgi:3-hydroxyisobutyrate dehydrogenase